MLPKNLSPFGFATKVCSRRPPQPEMTLVVRGTFALSADGTLTVIEDPLDRGSVTGDLFADDDRDNECIYGSDFADFKLSAEVLLTGSCHAPGGQAVTECPVQLQVGQWSKSLHVFGPRRWSAVGRSKPEPFESMPLSYQNAFGGPGYDLNPVGKGFKCKELPTVEHPQKQIATKLDRPTPASLAPLHPDWPQRRNKVGTQYGKAWRKKRAPYFAEDFDWRYFSAAAADQQLEGYLRGDEQFRLVNLHPDAPLIESRLPGLRARAFVKDVAGRFREVEMRLDTLFFALDLGHVHLTWRGVDEVMEDDLEDVAYLLIASDKLDQEPESEEHYRTILEKFAADPTGFYADMDPKMLELAERMEQAGDGEDPYPDAPDQGNPVSNLLARKLGPFASEMQEKVKAGIEDGKEQLPEDPEEKKLAVRGKMDEALEKASELDFDSPPVPVIPKPGAMPDPGLRPTMRKILAQVEELRKAADEEGMREEDRDKLLAQAEELEQVPHDPRWTEMDPEYTPPVEPIPTDEPGPGRNLSEQDLSGRDLSGMDLSGANLKATILTKANLKGANLKGANLTKAILYKTDLTGADLSEADLTRANGAAMRAKSACFRGATLNEGFFEKADFEEADLEGVTGSYQAFAHSKWTGAKATGAQLTHSDFSHADLSQADLSQGDFTRSVFEACRGPGVRFVEAKLERSCFSEAEFDEADFTAIDADRSIWLSAKLDGADFRYAKMREAHFTKSKAEGINLSFANMSKSRLYRVRLEKAQLVQANLFKADLCKARLTDVNFSGANLYDAKFIGAQGKAADFTGAILTRCTLEQE